MDYKSRNIAIGILAVLAFVLFLALLSCFLKLKERDLWLENGERALEKSERDHKEELSVLQGALERSQEQQNALSDANKKLKGDLAATADKSTLLAELERKLERRDITIQDMEVEAIRLRGVHDQLIRARNEIMTLQAELGRQFEAKYRELLDVQQAAKEQRDRANRLEAEKKRELYEANVIIAQVTTSLDEKNQECRALHEAMLQLQEEIKQLRENYDLQKEETSLQTRRLIEISMKMCDLEQKSENQLRELQQQLEETRGELRCRIQQIVVLETNLVDARKALRNQQLGGAQGSTSASTSSASIPPAPPPIESIPDDDIPGGALDLANVRGGRNFRRNM